MLNDETLVVLRSDRKHHLPWSLEGGAPGTPCLHIVNPGDGQRILPPMPMDAVRFDADEVFLHIGAGGGGYGDPLERDPQLVREDVLEEHLTTDYAAAVYGVIIDSLGEIDEASTAERRDALRQGDGRPTYLEFALGAHGIDDFHVKDGIVTYL
jgi:N-methylhydantoinase B